MPKNPFRKEPGPPDRSDKITRRARQVLQRAQEEAQHLGHSHTGAEHFLPGLLGVTAGTWANVLGRYQVAGRTRRSPVHRWHSPHPSASRALMFAIDEAALMASVPARHLFTNVY